MMNPKPYEKCHILYFKDKGHIIFRLGTKENVELFDMEAYVKRQGIGTFLLKEMCNEIDKMGLNPRCIFGFTAENNDPAQAFYKAIGFKLTELKDLYRIGCHIFILRFNELKKLLKQRL